jgi:hypothetical protein
VTPYNSKVFVALVVPRNTPVPFMDRRGKDEEDPISQFWFFFYMTLRTDYFWCGHIITIIFFSHIVYGVQHPRTLQ